MATLTGTQIANTYKQLLQVGSGNNGLTASVQTVQDGQGNNSALQLSQSAVNIDGTFQLNGVTLTANASALNNIADLTGATGIIAVSGGNVYGRTLTGGTGVSITNADGTEGNPTIALNPTGVVSASYGPATNIEINSVGQVVSAGAATSVSVSGVTANTFTGGTFAGTTGDFSSNVSVGGNLVIAGQFSPASLSVTGTINATKISATDATFNNVVSAGFFVGDGSGLVNVPSAEGGTVKAITAGTGIKLTIDAAVTTTIPVSGTVAVSANQNFGSVSVSTALAVTGSALFGIVSATNIDTDELLIAGVSAATVTEVAAVSALTQINLDSITSINGIIEGNVSADSGTFNTLTVVTSASVGGTFTANGVVKSGSTGSNGQFDLGRTSDGLSVGKITMTESSQVMNYNNVLGSGIHSFSVNNTERLRINSSGNVLIGTTSDTTDLAYAPKLKLSGSGPVLYLEETDTSQDYSVTALGGKFYIRDATAVVPRLTIDSSGNVGIGIASPATKFHVLDGTSSLRFRQNGTVAETLTVGPSGGDAAIYLGDIADTVRAGLYYDTSENDLQIRGYNNSTRILIDSAGNVGIGTTAPDGNLNVQRTAASAGWIINGQTVGVANDSGLFMDASNNIELAVRNGSGTLTGAVRSSGITFFNGGNVGIGTSSPDGKLDIATGGSSDVVAALGGTFPAFTYRNGTGSWFHAGKHPSSDYFYIGRGGTPTTSVDVVVDSTGNLGIGTTSPLARFNVNAGGAIVSSDGDYFAGGAYFNGGWKNSVASQGGWVLRNTAGELAIQTAPPNGAAGSALSMAERMRIDGNGNVGINTTTTLGAKLFVSQGAAASPATSGNMTTGAVIGSSTAGQALNVGTDADGVWYNAAYANNAGVARIHRWLTGGTERMRIDTSGTVTANGILKSGSTGSNGQFDLARTSDGLSVGKITMTESSQVMNYNNVLGSGIHSFSVNNTERMRINSSGNVGIGTTSPAKQLHITKAAKADIGTLTDGATITPNFDANQNFSVTLGGNRTLANPTNIDAGQTGSIFVVQDGTGSRTLSFGTYWKFAGGTAPTLSTAAGSVDRIDYIVYTTTAIHAVATLNVS